MVTINELVRYNFYIIDCILKKITYIKEGFNLNKKYVLKGLFLIILIPLMVHYFLKTPVSEVTISSIFILIFMILGLYDEITLSKNSSVKRNTYQLIIDRLLVLVLIVISMDVLIAFFAML